MADDLRGSAKVSISHGGRTVETTLDELSAIAKPARARKKRAPSAPSPVEEILTEAVADALGVPAPEEVEPARLVNFSMAGEDMRALLSRLLVFTAEGKDAPIFAGYLYLHVAEQWVVGFAGDDYRMAVQKIRCRADGAGVLVLDAEDARAILAMVPRPREEIALADVTVDFIHGSEAGPPRPVNVMYRDFGRVRSHSTWNQQVTHPDFRATVEAALAAGYVEKAQTAVQPAFLADVSKAAKVARDQAVYSVRWRIASPSAQVVESHGADTNGPLVASFSYSASHDLFVALLMPLHVAWAEGDYLHGLQARLFDVAPESDRIRPVMPEVLA